METLLGFSNVKGRFHAEFLDGRCVALPLFLQVVDMPGRSYGIRLADWPNLGRIAHRIPTYVIYPGASRAELQQAIQSFEVIEGVKAEL